MSDQRTTIGKGFYVEKPDVFLPWGSPLVELRKRLANSVLEESDGALRVECEALSGLQCRMWVRPTHEPYGPIGTTMASLLFWRPGPFKESFPDIQKHLEMTFGPALEVIPGSEEGPGEYKWVLDGVIIGHHTDYKMAPQEVTIIRKT